MDEKTLDSPSDNTLTVRFYCHHDCPIVVSHDPRVQETRQGHRNRGPQDPSKRVDSISRPTEDWSMVGRTDPNVKVPTSVPPPKKSTKVETGRP